MSGTGTLLRFFVRRDRWMVLWWVLGGVLLYWSQAISVEGLYPTQAEFDRAAEAMAANPAFVAMAGPTRALNTIGGQVTWQASAFGAILAGLMSMFLVGRHTRDEEASGRDELLRAGAVDRHATSVAALIEVGLANLLLGALVALSLISVPLEAADAVGLGVGVALCGWLFGAVALLAVQLTSATRTAYGVTGGVIALSYALRAVGDASDSWASRLSWLSPIGWYQGMHPFSGLRWWPAALLAAATVLVALVALAVFARRDHGSGVLPDRPGAARAGRSLPGPAALGLAWRLQRGGVAGWACGLVAGGLAFGTIGDQVSAMVGDSDLSRDLVVGSGADLVAGFYATALGILALLVAGLGVSTALRARGEEEAGRLEALLVTGLPRARWIAGQALLTLLVVTATLLASGLALGAGYALVTGDGGAVLRLGGQSLAYLPAVLVLASAARLLAGVAPRFAVAAWALLALTVVIVLFGTALDLPGWLTGVSGFDHLARVPAESFDPVPYVAECLLALLLSAGGQLGFRRRDLASG